jgi:type I restriction enzyme S subunit
MEGTSGRQRVSWQQIASIEIPDLRPDHREEIGNILGLLDDKIELNRRMAATLEEMAQALYRSWFVDFDPVKAKAEGLAPAFMDEATAALFPDRFGDEGLPDGWNFGKLGDVAITPRSGVKPEQIDPDTPYIGLEHMPRRSIALFDWGSAADISSQKSLMSKGDFLFGKLRPYFHKVGIVPINGICSTDIVVVRPKSPEWGSFVLAAISSDEFVEHTNSGSSGTRMPRTSWAEMARYEVVLPNPEVATRFEEITKPWRDRIVEIAHENRTLAALRDTLLPKLMSGELRVGEAREQVEDAA